MIYFISDGEYTKIGFTDKDDIQRRLTDLQVGNPKELKVAATMIGGREEEAILHRVLGNLWVRGEWFRLSLPGCAEQDRGATPVQRAAEAAVRYEEEARQAHEAMSGETFDRRLVEEILAIKRTKAAGVLKAGVHLGLWREAGQNQYKSIRESEESNND